MFTGSIVALVTPFEDGGDRVDYTALKNLVELHLDEGTDAIVIGGTTGEGPTLEKEEFCSALEFVLKEVNGKIPVIAGTGTNSTKKTIEMTALAQTIGANGALIITPYYNKPTDQGVLSHFKEISKIGLPYIAYHHPGRCGIELGVEALIELSLFDHLVGIKECSRNRGALRELLEKRPSTTILSGDDDRAIEMIQMGAKGSISVIANLLPGAWKKIIHAAMNHNFREAEELYKTIKSLVWAITLEVNPQGIKCALAKKSLCKDVLRLPLLPVTDDTREEIHEALEKLLT